MKTPLLLLCMIIGFNASATNYYFSTSGSDYNSGTDPSSAYQTLNKLNSLYLQPGDYVYFRRGDTFYGSINISRSGTAASPIRFGAYGSGAKPVITGFTSVTSWTSLGGNIWESTSAVSGLPYTNMVSINGGNTPMGRYPNSGYLTFQSHNGNTSITSSALPSYPNWTGAEVAIRKVRYAIETGTITSHSGNTLYFTDEKLYTPKDNFGFFIQDDSRTLDVQNEWYYNPSTKKLRVYSSSYPNNVKIATVERLVNGGGSAASYINFDNIAFTGANSYSFYLAQKNYVSITNCDILYSGGDGILADGSYSVNIQNNTISYTNGNAIKVTGSSTNSTVRYNNIRSSGMVPGMIKSHALGSIYIGGDNSIVEFNNLDSSGYNGIRFNANNVKVRNNFINHSCMIIDDGGGIYTDANKSGREITGNIVLNSMGTSEGTDAKGNMLAHGIFLDDQTVYVTVQGNSVSSCRGAGIFIHNASDLVIKDNTCFDNGIEGNWIKGGIMFQYDWSKPLRNIQLHNNIFFAKTAQQLTLFGYTGGYDPSDIKQLGSADYNYYARPLDGNNTINLSSSTVSWPGVNLNLSSWKTYSGQDYNSQAAKKTTTSTSDLRFVYNASSSSRTIALDASYIDVKGISYNGSITLAPYTSAVLTKNGAATATTQQPPVANAGSDIYVTLPANTAQLSGSGTSTGGSITGYAWTKVSGPSATITSPYSASTSITGLTEGSYIFQLTVTDNLSATDKDSVKVTVSAGTTLLPAIYPSNTVNGLDYKYYEATDYSVVPSFSTSAVKAGTVSTFTLLSANRATDYSFNFTGYIDVPADGQYTFYTNSDDGSKLYIDNVLVVNNDGLHGTVEKSGTIGLKAGKHAISVGYFQKGGDATLSVSYSRPNVAKQVIPGSSLYRVSTTTSTTDLLPAIYPSNTVNGLDYKYYEATDYSVVPSFSTSAVKAGTVSTFTLSAANRATDYSFNFTGYINVPADGQYTFYTNSDDGSKLYIDNVLVVNNDGLHGTVEKSGTIGLKAGKHAISVGYFQKGGDATLSVSYSGPNVAKQVIPGSSLYRVSTTTSTTDLLPAVYPSNTVNGLDYKYYEATDYSVVPSFSTSAVKAGTVSTFTLSAANRATDYSFNFTGYINVPSDGQYTFYTNSDDGSKLYIDNVLVVNNDGLHGTIERSGTIGLKAGKHAITVGYFQKGGDAVLGVSYSGPGVGKQTIPASALYRVSSTSSTNLLPAVYPSNIVNGLDYKYYEASNYTLLPDFDHTSAVKAGTVSTFSLSAANRTANYGFNFKGYINVPSDGQYTFYTASDDGSKLYIDNVLVVNNDGLHGTIERSGTVGLKAGKHAITVGFFQQAGDAILSVSYSGPNIAKQGIPSSVLYRSLASTTVARMDISSTTATNQVNGSLQTNTEVNNQALSNNQEKAKVSVYPNPFSDHIEVHINQPQAGAFRLMLMDAAGKVLWNTESVNASTSYHEIVNTSAFPIGVYFLKMIQNDKSTTVKLIKQYKN